MIEISIIFLYFFISGIMYALLDSFDKNGDAAFFTVISIFWIVSAPIMLGIVLGKLIVKIFK